MNTITHDMAQQLINLLDTIDAGTDQHPDWIDAVCTAREQLQAGTVEALRNVALGSLANDE